MTALQSRVRSLEAADAALSRAAEEQARLRVHQEEGPHAPGESGYGGANTLRDASLTFRWDAAGNVTGTEQLPEQYAALVATALKTGHVDLARIPRSDIGKVGTRLGEGANSEGFSVSYPDATVVEPARPAFKWRAVERASSYTAFLKDVETGEEIDGDPTRTTWWTPPKPLTRGHRYTWMVEAEVGDKRLRAPAPDQPFAQFKLLGEAQERDLAAARQKWRGSHLLMGLLYARYGLKEPAERELRALATANPQSSQARALERSLSKHQLPRVK